MRTTLLLYTVLSVCLSGANVCAHDVDGDGQEGLAEAIHALQVASGSDPDTKWTHTESPFQTISTLGASSTISVPELDHITDITVSVILTYPDMYDLNLILVGPNGSTNVTLWGSAPACSGRTNLRLVFADDAATYAVSACSANDQTSGAAYRPMAGSLSVFDGLAPAGNWRLQIANSGVDSGTLVSWTLEIDTAD